MGQSNIAAGATIGSNHNSRAADGEFVTGRGFWPGLCVSLKHNSTFATFTLLAKGDYQYEMNIPLPFSLVSNDEANNRLVVMPAYWFMYNLYALARNEGKYAGRDQRTDRTQFIEYASLAPDSINEIFTALDLLRKFTSLSYNQSLSLETTSDEALIQDGETLLNDASIDFSKLEIFANSFENNSRPVLLTKVREAYAVYKKLVSYYGATQLLEFIEDHKINTFDALLASLPQEVSRLEWANIGGQLMPVNSVKTLLSGIKDDDIQTWDEVHEFYRKNSALYAEQKLQHAFASLLEIVQLKPNEFTPAIFKQLLQQTLETKEWLTENIYQSRAKDYQSKFRKMIYDNEKEMEEVIGKLEDNVFIQQQKEELNELRSTIESLISAYNL
jgi:hypothetical protein